MENLIKKLISNLNKDDDFVLLFFLKQKLGGINYEYNDKFSFTEKELKSAKTILKRELKVFSDDIYLSGKYGKVKGLMDRMFVCENCKLSIKRNYNYRGEYIDIFVPDKNNKVCDNCLSRYEKFEKIIDEYDINNEKSIDLVVSEQHILLKSALTKIRRKLKMANKLIKN